MSEERTERWLYEFVVRKFGVPARTYHDETGAIHMEGPFTPLDDAALERVLTLPTQSSDRGEGG